MTRKRKSPLDTYGLQSSASRKCGIAKTTVCHIFNGKRRATLKQAAQLEEYFMMRGIPINRWDLLYGVNVEEEQSLSDYLEEKTTEAGQRR